MTTKIWVTANSVFVCTNADPLPQSKVDEIEHFPAIKKSCVEIRSVLSKNGAGTKYVDAIIFRMQHLYSFCRFWTTDCQVSPIACS